jgi:peptide/nickel transport system permease protein
LKYFLLRGLALMFSLVVGMYLTVFIAGMGGYVDKIQEAQIREQVGLQVLGDPAFKQLPPSEQRRIIDERVELERQRLGLDTPFIRRSVGYLVRALGLDLGRAKIITSDSGSKEVRLILLERLPSTLVLFSTANLLLFFATLFLGLYLSRRYGSIADRLSVALAPLSAAPGWFYGIILILIFAAMLKVLPFGGMVDAPPPDTTLGYALSVGKHMILPVLAMFVSGFFISVYSRRTFFLIFSSEDHVELGRAKGVPNRALERRYILRPTLPTIITQFALMLIVMWMGAIILETVFNWPGLGSLYYSAIQQFEIAVILGETVIYAYLLALTLFLLDIVYAIVDPRVKVGAGAPT